MARFLEFLKTGLAALLNSGGRLLLFLRDFIKLRWKKILLYGTILAVGANVLLVGTVFIVYLFNRGKIATDLDELRLELTGQGPGAGQDGAIKIYSRHKKLIGEYLPRRGSRLTMDRCAKLNWLNKAAVSSEDREFYNHGGVSYRGVARAFINNITSFSVREGAGSITMQVARNLFADRSYPGLPRKIYETFVAFQIEGKLEKKEILCLYLNKIYMGEGRIGSEEAARFYFQKPPEELTAAEAAMIVGLFPSPVYYSPLNNTRFSLHKQKMVMTAMVRDGHTNEKLKDFALKQFRKKWKVSFDGKKYHPGKIGKFGASRDFRRNAAPAANEYVKKFLYDNLSEEIIQRGNLRVYTTIDYNRQRSAESAIRNRVAVVRAAMLKGGKKNRLSEKKRRAISHRLNGVLISMEPRTGDVFAVMGGYRTTEGGVMTHRAWTMRRQPGSCMKGFLYASALDQNVYHLNSKVTDRHINYGGYSPRNWYRGYKGEMSLRKAVALSVNTIAVTTLKKLGVGPYRSRLSAALELGFLDLRKRFPGNLSLALGSAEMTPIEVARVYSTFLNGGYMVRPRLVIKILDAGDNEIWAAEKPREPETSTQVLSPEAGAGGVELMRGIFEKKYAGTMGWVSARRDKNFNYLPFPIAGKSGTVQMVPAHRKKFPGMPGVHDAWFVGLVPGEVTVLWFGHDAGAPFPGGGSSTGGKTWVAYAQDALPGIVSGDFPTPPEAPAEPDNPLNPDSPDVPPESPENPDNPDGPTNPDLPENPEDKKTDPGDPRDKDKKEPIPDEPVG